MKAPKSFRLHIGIFGKRNVGKSSILNALTQQDVSIVSEIAGTTTDPVEKPMELLPLGPVLFIDTAGIDDIGVLGEKRVNKTLAVFDRTDLGVIVTNFGEWGEYEHKIIEAFKIREVPFLIVFNKTDQFAENSNITSQLDNLNIKYVATAATTGYACIVKWMNYGIIKSTGGKRIKQKGRLSPTKMITGG